MSESEIDTKEQFINKVREDGAELDGVTYFTEGEGSATTYHARNEDGEEEQVKKSEVEAAWKAVHGDEDDEPDEEEAEEEGPEEVHLGTFYMASSWEERHREAFEEALDDLDWFVGGEVDSGGLRVFTEE